MKVNFIVQNLRNLLRRKKEVRLKYAFIPRVYVEF